MDASNRNERESSTPYRQTLQPAGGALTPLPPLPTPLQERTHPPLLFADMEPLYVEELRSAVSLLMANLESLPVTRGGGADLRHRLKRSSVNSSFLDLGDEGDTLSKSDVALSFTLEVSGMYDVVWL